MVGTTWCGKRSAARALSRSDLQALGTWRRWVRTLEVSRRHGRESLVSDREKKGSMRAREVERGAQQPRLDLARLWLAAVPPCAKTKDQKNKANKGTE